MPEMHESKPLTAEQVVERLLESVGGQIVACNVAAGIQNGLVDAAWATKVLAWIGTLGALEDYREPAQLVRALDDLQTRGFPPSASLPSDPPDIRLGGVDASVPFEVEVSCVLPAWRLVGLVLDQDRQRLVRAGLALPRSSTDVLTAAMVDQWQRSPARARMVRLDPAATLGRQHSVIWFAPRESLEAALATEVPNAHAQRARDLLGLVHHQEGTMLAAMHFQPPTLSARASARPTFADAGGHTRFKTWPDGGAARSQRDWGHTVDLRALDASDASLDGCPERVIASIDDGALSNDATFELEMLGPVRTPVADGGDAAFAKRLLNGRTVTDLSTELMALCN